jgi:hypothetical protein
MARDRAPEPDRRIAAVMDRDGVEETLDDDHDACLARDYSMQVEEDERRWQAGRNRYVGSWPSMARPASAIGESPSVVPVGQDAVHVGRSFRDQP